MTPHAWAQLATGGLCTRAQLLVRLGGETVVDAHQGVEPHTRFPLFSLSKTLTAVTLLTLVDEGLLELDRRVSSVVPAFGAHRKADVTVAEVLLHTGGFPDPPSLTAEVFLDEEAGLAAICAVPLRPELRGTVSYHGLAYGVLGAVAAAAAGQPFAELCQQRVLDALGMRDTSWGPGGETGPDAGPVPASAVATALGAVAATPGLVAPAFSAWSTAHDIDRLLTCLSREGAGPAGAVLSPGSARGMTRTLAHGQPISTGWGTFTGRAFARGTRVSTEAFGHSGATSVQAFHDPAVDMTLVALTDSAADQEASDARFDVLADACYDSALDCLSAHRLLGR